MIFHGKQSQTYAFSIIYVVYLRPRVQLFFWRARHAARIFDFLFYILSN